MGKLLLIVLAMAAFAGVPVALQWRLRKRHPEVHDRLTHDVVEDRVVTRSFRRGALWRFLARRDHKTMNDPVVSVLSDLMLVGTSVFVIVLVGGLIWVFGSAFRQIF